MCKNELLYEQCVHCEDAPRLIDTNTKGCQTAYNYGGLWNCGKKPSDSRNDVMVPVGHYVCKACQKKIDKAWEKEYKRRDREERKQKKQFKYYY